MGVVVFGSLNMDLLVRVARLPLPGETLAGYDFAIIPGGKGANQAIASVRMGASTRLVGRVGADGFGEQLRRSLERAGISPEDVVVDATAPTGVALITVATLPHPPPAEGSAPDLPAPDLPAPDLPAPDLPAPENQIVIAAGANGQVGDSDLQRLQALLPTAQVLLLQLEIPLATVVAAAEMAHRAGVFVILDPAPAPDFLPLALYSSLDLLTPNQTEAAQLVGFAVEGVEDAVRAAQVLGERGLARVVVTLGAQGAIAYERGQITHLTAHAVWVADPTAAGDAFNGALAAALAQGQDWSTALTWAMAAGAIAVTKLGAQPSLPTYAEVQVQLAPQASPEAPAINSPSD